MQYLTNLQTGRLTRACLLVTLAALLGGCPNLFKTNGPPTIEYTYVPPFGSFQNLRGRASGFLALSHRVVVYIRVSDRWWVKPTAADPLTFITIDGRWETDITTGGIDEEAAEIRAYLVPASFAPEVNSLPPEDVILASISTTRKPTIRLLEIGRIGTPSEIRGTVDSIDVTRYRVVAYIHVAGTWWVKPTAASPLTRIRADRTWAVDAATVPTDTQATRVWVGVVREDLVVSTSDLPASADVIASACLARGVSDEDICVDCDVEDMFEFVERQLLSAGNDPVAGGLPSAFATAGTVGLPDNFVEYASDRAEVYDASIALVTMAKLTPRRREPYVRQIADALVFAAQNDPAGDGRIRDAYYSSDIRAPEPNRGHPSVLNGETHVGNAAWAIIALCNAYVATSDARYLTVAADIGEWIESHMRAEDELGGYYGGMLFPSGTSNYSDTNLERVEWRSVEHNADLVVAFGSLATLTADAVWSERAEHARRFVAAPSVRDCDAGFLHLGTTSGVDINPEPLAEDTASWPWLAGIRPCGDAPLQWAISGLRTTSSGFDGIRFSTRGDGVVSESTAHLALALRLAGEQATAAELVDGLTDIWLSAPNGDGLGLVAAPVPGGGVRSGLGARYYAAPHLASTCWTILAVTVVNPLEAGDSP